MSKQLESFKTYLEEFAIKHKSDIKKNAEFRGHFQQMCARIGVDPLACMCILWETSENFKHENSCKYNHNHIGTIRWTYVFIW